MSVRVMVVPSSPLRIEPQPNRSSLPPIFLSLPTKVLLTVFTIKDPVLDTELCLTKDIELLNVVS